jgi:hypothetical protein
MESIILRCQKCIDNGIPKNDKRDLSHIGVHVITDHVKNHFIDSINTIFDNIMNKASVSYEIHVSVNKCDGCNIFFKILKNKIKSACSDSELQYVYQECYYVNGIIITNNNYLCNYGCYQIYYYDNSRSYYDYYIDGKLMEEGPVKVYPPQIFLTRIHFQEPEAIIYSNEEEFLENIRIGTIVIVDHAQNKYFSNLQEKISQYSLKLVESKTYRNAYIAQCSTKTKCAIKN